MTQVIILCGGKGSRMREFSAYPKPLVKIGGIPILKYLIDFFYKNKHKKIILATGYKSKKVEYFVERNFKNKITISDSGNVDILDRLKKYFNTYRSKSLFYKYYKHKLNGKKSHKQVLWYNLSSWV